MQWQLSDEQVAYKETLRDWLSDVAGPAVVRGWLDDGDSATFAGRLVDAGWAGVGVPEEQGGQGGGLVELALTAEQFGATAVPGAAWLTTVLALPALQGFPDVAEAALAGEHLAMLHPAEALPYRIPRLIMSAEGAVSGRVERVLAGAGAACYLVVVDGVDGPALRVVRRGSGVNVEPRRLLDRSRDAADVVLDGTPSERVDVDVEAFLAAYAVRSAVLTAADSLGAATRMLELAVAYSKQRYQFGVPIGSFQAVQHAAATILVAVEAARSAVYYAAASVDAGAPDSALHAAAVKAQVTDSAVRAADSALTLHGAIGFTWEHDLHLFYKRSTLNQALFGTPKQWNDVIADRLDLVEAQ